MLLTESGTMRLGGYTGPAEQTYRYCFPNGPRGRTKSSATTARRSRSGSDGRHRRGATHHCGADLYQGTFRVQGHDEWVVEWTVGDSKDYHMVTRHYRVSAGEE